MRSSELYFLIFACGSFGVLSLGLAINTIRYHRWRNVLARRAKPASASTSRTAAVSKG